MSTILTTRRFALWWRLAREWFESKFSNIKTSTPYITMDGSSVVFNYFTPRQMEKVYIWLEGGNLWFELTKDEEGQYSLTTKCDIQELDGMFVMGGEEHDLDTIVDTIPVYLKGYKVSEVRIEGIDADLLNADFTWKLAEIGNKVDNIKLPEIDTTELAKQGDNPEATNSAIYDAINAISPDLVQGKERLATAITSKGVETTSADSLSQMAENVSSIAQESYTIDGGEMYAKQKFCDGTLWNLYQVLADMKTRFMGTGDYSALIVCEYYKTDDSLTLQGADGYYTCDGDYYDYASPTHVWHDSDNGKVNRWVAFLYRDEGARLDITNTDISPRSMYIGGHIGTIEYFINGRLTDFVCGVEETDVVDNLNFGSYTQSFGFNTTIRNIKNSSGIVTSSGGCVSVEIEGDTKRISAANATFIEIKKSKKLDASTRVTALTCNKAIEIHGEDIIQTFQQSGGNLFGGIGAYCQVIDFPSLTNFGSDSWNGRWEIGECTNLIDIIVGEVSGSRGILLQKWNPTNVLADATKKARLIDNIKNHILARVSDRTGLSQLVFGVTTNMYNAIAGEQIEWQGETMSLADAFLTKNWLLAGA